MTDKKSHKKKPILKPDDTEVPDIQQYEENHFIDTSKPVWNYSLLTDEDVTNFQAGTQYQLYKKFGSHVVCIHGRWGMYFCVWAPNATSVSVKGNFNKWKNHEYELFPRWDKSGIWEGFIPDCKYGEAYKYHIVGYAKRKLDKAILLQTIGNCVRKLQVLHGICIISGMTQLG
jgi:1,4-alpha-glucan branching enzyme